MNFINTIIILLVIIFIINYLTDGKILKLFNDYRSVCENTIENFNGNTYQNEKENFPNIHKMPFTGQLDFPYMNNNTNDVFDSDTYNLYNFINTLITPNINQYELTTSNTKRILGNKDFHDKIIDYIYTITNSGYFIFDNIKLLNKIFYYINPRGKDIELFKFNSNVYLNNGFKKRFIGNFIFSLELFIHEDKYSNFNKYCTPRISQSSQNEFIAIINIKLLGNITKKNNINKHNTNINKAIDINNKMNDSFNNYFVKRDIYDDLFIKPADSSNIINDTENSLIPSIINISQSVDDNT
jgi:hypothetical protein